MSTQDSYWRIKELFAEAMEKPVEQRSAFLDDACKDAPQLRAEVEALLAAVAHGGGLMSHPIPTPVTIEPETAAIREGPGTVIGRYRILEKIGEGGFGAVYIAEQKEPVRRRVALKIIKLGMDSRAVVARFEAERQAVAMMDHPNIAKVFDAGTTESGRPYFVMELVRGIPITEYCDMNSLPATARLELFTQVCHAIQHAHQKGIIHRDVKPSNILISLHDGVPVPKIIDFGIAKATQGELTDKTVYTQFQQFIGTPAYMSPEQADLSGLDIDTRSDIYSLGVLLYELLTGKTPFDGKELLAHGLDAMRRAIREQEPPKPSTRLSHMLEAESTSVAKQRHSDTPRLMHAIRGDLDSIVMKCLEKDRTRRYETANGLAMDIRRHLNNEPVIARPASAAYRFQKVVRRNKLAFAAAGAVVLALLLGLGVSTWEFFKERSARRIAVALKQQADDQTIIATTQRDRAQTAEKLAGQRGEDLRRHLYVAQMAWASQAAELPSGIQRIRELIEPWREGTPDLRGWEWYYLNALSHPELMSLDTHSGRAYSVAWSPDGTRLACGDLNGRVHIWAADSGRLLRSFDQHETSVDRLAWSPDGTRLASASSDCVLKVWDVNNGRELFTFRSGSQGTIPMAWAPDGNSLAYGSGTRAGAILIRNLQTNVVTRTLPGRNQWVSELAWSPDGQRLASSLREYVGGSATGFTIKVWDVQAAAPTDLWSETKKALQSLLIAWSPDGARLACSGEGGVVRIWNMGDRQLSSTFVPHPDAEVEVLAWDPSSTRMLTRGSADRTMKVWDLASGKELFNLRGHMAPVFTVSWKPDGTQFASAGFDGTVKIWAAARTRHYRVVGAHADTVYALAWSPDGRQLASAGRDATFKVWDADRGQETAALKVQAAQSRSVAWHPDGSLLACGDSEGLIRVWDYARKSEPTILRGHTNATAVLTLGWSPDRKRLASGGSDKRAKIWDSATGKELFTFPTEPVEVRAVAWSPDGTWLATAGGSSIKIHDPGTGKQISWLQGHSDRVYALAWSPDGRQIASASLDATIKTWDAASGKEIRTLRGHTDQVIAVAWSPDGTRLASAGRERVIKIWNPVTGEEIFSSRMTGYASGGMVWSTDGMKLAVTDGNEICVLDATQKLALQALVPTTSSQ